MTELDASFVRFLWEIAEATASLQQSKTCKAIPEHPVLPKSVKVLAATQEYRKQ